MILMMSDEIINKQKKSFRTIYGIMYDHSHVLLMTVDITNLILILSKGQFDFGQRV